LWVPGNHDPETSYYLVDTIREHYRSTDRVTVDLSARPRKYYQWGCGLVGFTHGDEEPSRDLPAIMAAEVPELWSATTCREWHTGHFHKKKETRYSAGDTYGGVFVRVLPSLSSTDYWHHKKGYLRPHRTGEAYLWSKAEGCIGQFSATAQALLSKAA
jgi:hypothetical protein